MFYWTFLTGCLILRGLKFLLLLGRGTAQTSAVKDLSHQKDLISKENPFVKY